MTFMDDRQMRINRIVSIFNTTLFVQGELLKNWHTVLFPIIGALMMAYIPAQWLKQRLYLYNRAYWSILALGLTGLIGRVGTESWFNILLGSLWFMMFLATFPPDSGEKRRALVTKVRKIVRSWAVGISITTGAS